MKKFSQHLLYWSAHALFCATPGFLIASSMLEIKSAMLCGIITFIFLYTITSTYLRKFSFFNKSSVIKIVHYSAALRSFISTLSIIGFLLNGVGSFLVMPEILFGWISNVILFAILKIVNLVVNLDIDMAYLRYLSPAYYEKMPISGFLLTYLKTLIHGFLISISFLSIILFFGFLFVILRYIRGFFMKTGNILVFIIFMMLFIIPGGLMFLGEEFAFGLGVSKGSELVEESSLIEADPLESLPPYAKAKKLPSALALVLDKSGSMNAEGRIEATRLAALKSIDSLPDEDYVSVIGYDHKPLVLMGLQKVGEAKQRAEKRLDNMTAQGQTNLLPALLLARSFFAEVDAGKKHIIVLTDGIFAFKAKRFSNKIASLKSEGISISTIALGNEADIPIMKNIAQQGNGQFYHVLDSATLPEIFIEDIKAFIGEGDLKE